MEKFVLRKIKFGSFVKIAAFCGLGMGVIIGALMLIMALLGANVTANVGNIRLYGMQAGIFSFITSPIITPLIASWFALLTYPVFLLVIKIKKGIKIEASIEPLYPAGTPNTPAGMESSSSSYDHYQNGGATPK